MNKYNVFTVDRNGQTYNFVTRGKSKPFSKHEVEEFFSNKKPVPKGFKLPDHLRNIFSQDLKNGLAFCSQKYGATEQEIMEAARSALPTQNIDRLIGE